MRNDATTADARLHLTAGRLAVLAAVIGLVTALIALLAGPSSGDGDQPNTTGEPNTSARPSARASQGEEEAVVSPPFTPAPAPASPQRVRDYLMPANSSLHLDDMQARGDNDGDLVYDSNSDTPLIYVKISSSAVNGMTLEPGMNPDETACQDAMETRPMDLASDVWAPLIKGDTACVRSGKGVSLLTVTEEPAQGGTLGLRQTMWVR